MKKGFTYFQVSYLCFMCFVVGVLIILSGCSSSYKDCTRDCRSVHYDDFLYDATCNDLTGKNPQLCDRLNWTARKQFCYEQCK